MTPRDEERDEHGKRYTLSDLITLCPDVDWQVSFSLPHAHTPTHTRTLIVCLSLFLSHERYTLSDMGWLRLVGSFKL